MRRRVSSSLLLLTVGLSVVSCHVGPTSKSSRSRGDSLLARRDYAGAQSQFERAVSLSSTPQQKARALIGLGRSQLRAGRPEAALKTFHAARKASSDPSLRGASDRWIGEAQLDVGNFGIALRYLRKGLRGMKGETRQRTLAYISFCYRESGDKATAAKYRKKLNYPLSNDIAAIVDGKSRRLVAAKKRVRDQTPKRLATKPSRRQSTPKQTTRPRTKPRPRRAQRPMVIHDRREWQARRAKSNVSPMNRVTRLTIHHSAGDSFWEHSSRRRRITFARSRDSTREKKAGRILATTSSSTEQGRFGRAGNWLCRGPTQAAAPIEATSASSFWETTPGRTSIEIKSTSSTDSSPTSPVATAFLRIESTRTRSSSRGIRPVPDPP